MTTPDTPQGTGPLTVDAFLAAVYADIPRGWRRGQALFNGLAQARPVLAELVRGGPVDPFYVDARIPAAEAFIRDQWDQTAYLEPARRSAERESGSPEAVEQAAQAISKPPYLEGYVAGLNEAGLPSYNIGCPYDGRTKAGKEWWRGFMEGDRERCAKLRLTAETETVECEINFATGEFREIPKEPEAVAQAAETIRHTPGPWEVRKQADDPNPEPSVMAGDYYIATCHEEPGEGSAIANARLIAAAPDLAADLETSRLLCGRLADALEALYRRHAAHIEALPGESGLSDLAAAEAVLRKIGRL